MVRRLGTRCVFFALLWTCVAIGDEPDAGKAALPFPKEFDPARYLGKWYEIGRLASPSQPAGTLATAEYSRGKQKDEIAVKNTAFNAKGKPVRNIVGKAKLLTGGPPRLAVSFGPELPQAANYYVLHVGKDYDVAVVGHPDRKSLWILSRKPMVGEKLLKELVKIARDAGFATDALVFADWKTALAESEKTKFDRAKMLGTWEYVRGEKNGATFTESHFRGQTVEITKESMTLKSDQFTFVLKYELIPDSHPQALKLTITKSPFGAGQQSSGIVELTDGKLKLCYRPMGGETPERFAGGADSDQHYFELRQPSKPLRVADMVGRWKFESGVMEGAKSDKKRLEGSHVTIDKTTLTMVIGNAKFVMRYTIDAARQPATIHLKIVEGPYGEGAATRGIAQLKDGKLYICYHPRGGTAPTEFDAGEEHSLFILSPMPK